MALMQEAKSEIDMVGPNASLLGQMEGAQSGRAIRVQQEAGMAELAPIYDSLSDWTLRCYRAMWERIQQFWTEERWVRVTDDTTGAQFVPVNAPVGYDQFGQPVRQNDVAKMDVDIIVDAVGDVTSLRHETFDQLAQLAQQGIPIPPEMLVESSAVRDKKRILEMMKEREQQQMAMQAQAMQSESQRRDAETQAKVVSAQAGAMKDQATAAKTMQETQAAAQPAVILMPAAGAFGR
jgi:hypothetical protein